MGKIVKTLLGDSPKAQTTAPQDIEKSSKKARKARTALFETEGGVAGEELSAGGVTQRNTLLGN